MENDASCDSNATVDTTTEQTDVVQVYDRYPGNSLRSWESPRLTLYLTDPGIGGPIKYEENGDALVCFVRFDLLGGTNQAELKLVWWRNQGEPQQPSNLRFSPPNHVGPPVIDAQAGYHLFTFVKPSSSDPDWNWDLLTGVPGYPLSVKVKRK